MLSSRMLQFVAVGLIWVNMPIVVLAELYTHPSGEESIIQKIVIEMWDAVEHGDLDRYMKYIHKDYTAFGESDVYLAEGREVEMRSMKDFIQRSNDVQTEMHQPRITINGKVAWISYYWSDRGIVNGQRYSSRGKSTRIFVKEGESWLCIHAHFTAVQ